MPKDKVKKEKSEEDKKKGRIKKMYKKLKKTVSSSNRRGSDVVEEYKKNPNKKKAKRESMRRSMEEYFNGSLTWEGMLAKEELAEDEMAELCNEFELMKSSVNEADFDFSDDDGDESDDNYF